MNIALLGGSFNPITKAHINLAKYVLNSTLNINEVWLLPCYSSYYNKNLVDSIHRINMCNLATENEPNYNIKISDFEIKNKIKGSTADVLKELYKNYDHNFKFIIGMDNANNIFQWSDYKTTLNLIPFIVVDRIEFKKPDDEWYLHEILSTVRALGQGWYKLVVIQEDLAYSGHVHHCRGTEHRR